MRHTLNPHCDCEGCSQDRWETYVSAVGVMLGVAALCALVLVMMYG